MLKQVLAASAIGVLMFAAACSNENSAEKAGENLDSAIEQSTRGHENSGDGPMENAGEAIDSATGHENNDPVDALNDATDGKSSTTP
jgi:ABC-type phosphate/phosphonate transport system substrate-binding protein